MNIDDVKIQIQKNIGRNVSIKVFGLRNKTNTYEGKLISCYPNIFTVDVMGNNKSFTYADVITGEVKIKYN